MNSAGKANAGRSVNEDMARALCAELGIREGTIRFDKPSKGAGSVEYGERLLNIALHNLELFVARGCKATIRSLWHYVGKDDDTKHGIDALRYGALPVLLDQRRPSYSRLYVGWR